jgi:hypothetical protein
MRRMELDANLEATDVVHLTVPARACRHLVGGDRGQICGQREQQFGACEQNSVSSRNKKAEEHDPLTLVSV